MKRSNLDKKINLIILSLFLILISCNPSHKNYTDFYKNISEHFNSSFFNHFPDRINEAEGCFFKFIPPNKSNENGGCGGFLKINTSKDFITSLETKLIETSLEVYKSNDRCNLFVNLFQLDTAGKIFLEHYLEICKNDNTPLPQLVDRLSFTTNNYFSKDGFLNDEFNYYIIESQKGKFVESEQLSNGIGLPDDWKNGFTRGIAINSKSNIAIYWFEIW